MPTPSSSIANIIVNTNDIGVAPYSVDAVLRGDNVRLREENARLTLLVEKLTQQFAILKRMHFGQKSEAMSALMGDLFGVPTLIETPPTKALPPKKASAQPKVAPRITLPANLPVEIITLDLPEDQKIAADGAPLKRIGEEVSDRLAIVPGHFFIRRTLRPKYAHPKLPEQGIAVVALPSRIIDCGLLDESVLADIAIRKFDDHLPLHRIGEIYWRDGQVNLAKQTLSDAILTCANCLKPLHAAILTALKEDRALHIDETVLPLLAPGKTLKARAWAYVGTRVKLIYYDFTLDKAGQHVRERLQGFGSAEHPVYLHADAANNYDAFFKQYPHIREAEPAIAAPTRDSSVHWQMRNSRAISMPTSKRIVSAMTSTKPPFRMPSASTERWYC